jgi:ribosomal protein S18 acetylase RimI-like enzyme
VTTETGLSIVEATPEHAPFIAWVTLTAFRSHLERGFWDFMLDGDEAYKLRYLEALATTAERHWVHYSTFMVAEMDGRPVSALCGYIDNELGLPTLRMAGIEANQRTGRTEKEAAAGFERAKSIIKVASEHPPGAWVVENVATLPEFRRRGLIVRLMEEILERGRNRGATVADIGVFIGNDPAQRTYEKCGFIVTAEKRDPEFESVYRTPGTRTLRRSL